MGYSIKEVAEKVGLPTHTLRYYEKEGLLPFIKRDANGNRIFEEKDLSWLELVICLRKTDIALSELREIVNLTKEGDWTVPKRKQILEKHKEKMLDKQRVLERTFLKIDEKIMYYDGLEKKNQAISLKADEK
ncbi:MerR family transcriptional regulator [Bacillus haynesii]|uniref:MerR family transcriptional regulator n=1 Tax=Bacillus haynesii TaxID=1925021 RepID=UPI00159325EA|nr:MerR family transcriptional regulator [Bacillus haynesii]NVB33110.1 MerR family transcriptional regulator [Bacillus licheniformis]MCY7779722.1 MerR family transcriptional regulator [Bacillus haynesii]MEC0668665.1 MerR family transcriptional regulator [Bacillus haynesii]MEC1420384.1 MerR family transcriptional regulator [Bacillus haynesii]MEC1445810.1 MerR family transcriptional regulator [Bacillus haynesii]